MNLTGVVIAQDEESRIESCLQSLSFCDEIIVVDSHSKDRTREIAARFTPQVYERDWQGYGAQKNYAIGFAKADWILSIDADEVVTEELKNEIQSVLQSSAPHAAYSIPRKTVHFGRWIRYGGWYPNRQVRLFRKSQGRWNGDDLHERWETQGSAGELHEHLIHHSFENFADQVARNNHYSTLGAQALRKAGTRFSFYKLATKTLSKFLETYLLKMGFRDGYPGFIISVSAAYSVFMRWAKLWELENREKKG